VLNKAEREKGREVRRRGTGRRKSDFELARVSHVQIATTIDENARWLS
jgi:hypothetical protein